jgi:hypothetical protein
MAAELHKQRPLLFRDAALVPVAKESGEPRGFAVKKRARLGFLDRGREAAKLYGVNANVVGCDFGGLRLKLPLKFCGVESRLRRVDMAEVGVSRRYEVDRLSSDSLTKGRNGLPACSASLAGAFSV